MSQLDEAPEEASWQQSIYDHLYRIASAALAQEAPGHSLQPTLIVHDAYLRLMEQRNINLSSRSQVLSAAANIIRRLLVDYARRRKAEKRGGVGGRGISVDNSIVDSSPIDILELHDALDMLSQESPRAAKVVELRFFGGLRASEIAEQLCVSSGTVSNDWRYAKAWLYQALRSDSSHG